MTDLRLADLLARSVLADGVASLEQALTSGNPGIIGQVAVAAAADGRADVVLIDAITTLIQYDVDGLNGALVGVVACLRTLADHPKHRAALPVARGLDLVAHAIAGHAQRQLIPSSPDDPTALATFVATLWAPSKAAVAGAVSGVVPAAVSGVELAAAAELAVVNSAAAGMAPPQIADAVVDLLYSYGGRGVHLTPILVAVLEVARVADGQHAVEILARMARTLVLCALPAQDDHVALVDPIIAAASRLHGAADPAKSGAFQEARFRPHLLGAKPQILVRAVGKALAFGIPRERVATSLCLAAAERVLRFDPAIARSARRRETWLDTAWLLQICEAIRALGVLHDRPGWIGLLLHGALWLNGSRTLDAAGDMQLADPEVLARTWDHGPEIARVTGAMLRGDGDKAMAVLRGYLMMVLPEQPLAAAMIAAALEDRAASATEQGMLLATMVACLASFGAASDLPHRDLLPCAALRIWCAPQPPRSVFALVHRAVDRAEGATPKLDPSPLFWLHD